MHVHAAWGLLSSAGSAKSCEAYESCLGANYNGSLWKRKLQVSCEAYESCLGANYNGSLWKRKLQVSCEAYESCLGGQITMGVYGKENYKSLPFMIFYV